MRARGQSASGTMASMPSYAAIVLAGGGGRRLGGVDKASIRVGDTTLLARALDAVGGAARRVVVGPPRALPPGVVGVSEEPRGGGPVAGLAAGLAWLSEVAEVAEPLVVVLACDMPLIDRNVVEELVAEAAGLRCCDGVLLVDERGHQQPLAAAYRTDSLMRAIADLGTTRDAAMRSLVAPLILVDLPAGPNATLDCDTWESVARSHDLLEEA